MTTVHLLQSHPEVAENYRRRFRHVLVDEYQDTNHAQYVLVKELVAGTDGLSRPSCAWSATPTSRSTRSGARRSATSWSSSATTRDARTILLEQNYRSTQTILTAANAVIDRNTDRKPKRLWSDQGAGEQIVGYVADNEHAEADWVAREIDRLGDAGEARPGDVAVFYRTNAQSRVFEEVFIRVGLPYKVVGGVRFYERKEVRDALAYLRAVANDDDTVSVRRILNTPRRGIGDRAEACVEALSQPRADLVRRRAAPGRARRRASPPGRPTRSPTSSRCSTSCASWPRPAPPEEVLEAVLTPLRLPRRAGGEPRPAGRGPGGEPPGAGQRRPGVHRAGRGAARPRRRRAPAATLAGFLEQVALVADADQIPSDDPDHQGVVTLMTLHTAKGLEFPVVFLTGLEDGVFPHLRSLGDSTELEEERRLAYVGITRARQRLYLSRAVTRSAWGAAAVQPAVAVPRGAAAGAGPTGSAPRASYTSLGRRRRRRRRPRRRRRERARQLRRRHAEGGRSSPAGSASTPAS